MLRDAALFLAGLLSWACKPEPIEWGEARPLPPALASTTNLAFDAGQNLVARPPANVTPPVFTSQCTGSVRVARDTTGDWYAVWWSARGDSTALVVVSRSTDGVTWGPAVVVDSTDAGPVGCRRAAPSIYVDGTNIHVAYAMAAREGPGIFASHSMDRGMTFHSPVAVVYGEHIGETAIVARGNLVAVAYEDPNSDPQRVAVAFSRTMAHTFETRELASPPTGAARDPGVALGDGKIVVTWARGAAGGAGDTDASAPRVMRIGELR
jgi:hypothetical protein